MGGPMRRDPPQLTREHARHDLVSLLRLAFSAELAAALAYGGHRRSLRDPHRAAEVERIRVDEIDHRDRVGRMLTALDATPSRLLEVIYRVIGTTISVLCLAGGWFIPMYGAGVLESRNVTPYERAARLASLAGHPEFLEDLLEMAEIEWDHELYFRTRCEEHWLGRVFPRWTVPPPREEIRASFSAFDQRVLPEPSRPAAWPSDRATGS